MEYQKEIDFIIENLQIASLAYYNAWMYNTRFNQPAASLSSDFPRTNAHGLYSHGLYSQSRDLNYNGYVLQLKRSLLMQIIKNSGQISPAELAFLKKQPQIESFFKLHPDLEFNSLPNCCLNPAQK
jgi:hypothetical protein